MNGADAIQDALRWAEMLAGWLGLGLGWSWGLPIWILPLALPVVALLSVLVMAISTYARHRRF